MATFKPGESYNNQRVVLTNSFPQQGDRTGHNIAFSIANDTAESENVKTDPMLSYGTYKDAEGKTKNTYMASYSAKQMADIEAIANSDGDRKVITADLIPNKNGPGLVVNTKKMSTPEEPFDSEKHRENTDAARELKSEARKEAEAAKAAESENAPEKEEEQALPEA